MQNSGTDLMDRFDYSQMIHDIAEQMAFIVYREQGFPYAVANEMAKSQRDRFEGAAHAAIQTYEAYRQRPDFSWLKG